jgi:hypothetical protein
MPVQTVIDSSEALCQKLERTFYRRSSYGEHQVDWVFDVAVTAWHLVDWVTRERNAGAKADLSTAQADFKSRCPELAVCEQVCNGAKHFVLDDPKLKPFSVAANVKTTNDMFGVSRADIVAGAESVDIILTPTVQITDKAGQAWEAVLLFRSVLFFWQSELKLPRS